MKILDISFFNKQITAFQEDFYERNIPLKLQSGEYLTLLEMAKKEVRPSSLEELEEWYWSPSLEPPEIRFLYFLHPLLREAVRDSWDLIVRYIDISMEDIQDIEKLINKTKNNIDERRRNTSV